MPNVFNFCAVDAFKSLQQRVKDTLADRYQCDIQELEAVKKAKIIEDVRYDFDFMLHIENSIKQLIKGTPLQESNSMQFPVNLRISDGEVPPNYLKREFATDFIHLDSWANTPRDSKNFLIYIDFIGGPGSRCKVFERTFDKRIESYRGPYQNISMSDVKLREVRFEATPGQAVIFDNLCPHGTERLGSGVRISVDVRFRANSPYHDAENFHVGESDFLDGIPGAPSLGLYWRYTDRMFNSMQEKIQFELDEATKISEEASKLRIKYLDKLSSKSIFL